MLSERMKFKKIYTFKKIYINIPEIKEIVPAVLIFQFSENSLEGTIT